MPPEDLQLEGKAWWTQLQHDRAIEAGCHFYVHRPATTEGQTRQKFLEDPARRAAGRPSTVPLAVNARKHSRAAHTNGSHQASNKPCETKMRPSTSHLPARNRLSGQLSLQAISSTLGSSRWEPASRGNDWSPVHSRPVTRGMAVPQQQATTAHDVHPVLKPSTAARKLPPPSSKPSRHKHTQQRPQTTPMNKPEAAQDSEHTIVAAKPLPATPVPGASYATAPSLPTTGATPLLTETSDISTKHPSSQNSAASVHLFTAASVDSQGSVQKDLGVKQGINIAHMPAEARRRRHRTPQHPVKVVSMLNPGPRQHKQKLLEVWLES